MHMSSSSMRFYVKIFKWFPVMACLIAMFFIGIHWSGCVVLILLSNHGCHPVCRVFHNTCTELCVGYTNKNKRRFTNLGEATDGILWQFYWLITCMWSREVNTWERIRVFVVEHMSWNVINILVVHSWRCMHTLFVELYTLKIHMTILGIILVPRMFHCTYTIHDNLKVNHNNFKFRSITMFCGIDIIMRNIPHIRYEHEEYSMEFCMSHITLLYIWITL